jgi:hypothetical protein
MADVGKRPHDFSEVGFGSQALVKRQRTDEGALIVGSVTKDVSVAHQPACCPSTHFCLRTACDLSVGLTAAAALVHSGGVAVDPALCRFVMLYTGHQTDFKLASAHHAASRTWWGCPGHGIQPRWQQRCFLLI